MSSTSLREKAQDAASEKALKDRPADDGNKFDMNDMLAQFAQMPDGRCRCHAEHDARYNPGIDASQVKRKLTLTVSRP